jgi:hypothetical protein
MQRLEMKPTQQLWDVVQVIRLGVTTVQVVQMVANVLQPDLQNLTIDLEPRTHDYSQ